MAVQALTYRDAPAGSVLHVRLTTPVGSFASRPGSIVEAVLIAPVKVDGETVLPVGSVLRGRIKSVRRVGLGVIHEAASLDLILDSLCLPGGVPFKVKTQLASVDNGREEVTPSGTIFKARTTGSWGNHAAHYIRAALLWNVHLELAAWAVKSVVTQVSEPEIYLPTGAELTLTLSQRVRVISAPWAEDEAPGFTEDEREELAPVIADLPDRAFAGRAKKPDAQRPADIVNLLFVGSRDQVAAAFLAAGWTEARPSTFRANMSSALAAAFGHGANDAPMSSLRVNNAAPDMSWEKGFDDVSKRHHVRLWKLDQSFQGQDLWVAAATRDVEIGYLRPGHIVTHRVEEHVDHERDKIAWDISFSSCADAMDWWDRPAIPHETRNATGDRMQTDGELAVLKVNDCSNPREVVPSGSPIQMHGKLWQRLLRREILSARSDLIRGNIYWRSYEGLRCLVTAIHDHHSSPEPDAAPQRSLASRLQPTGLNSFVSFR